MSAIYAAQATPRDVARILFRHWRKITLISCSVVGLALLVIAVYPRSYLSESKLLIRIGRESVGLDPTATTGETVMLQKTQDEEVNSAVNILAGRDILERVVERVGADRILDDTPSIETADAQAGPTFQKALEWFGETLVALRLSDPGTKIDRAVRRLEKKTIVSAPKQSTVITVRFLAASPQLAHDVVNAMTDVFLEEHSRLNQAEGSLQFFAEQADKLLTDLTTAQETLRNRKNTYQLTSAQSRRSILELSKDALRQKVYDLQMQESDLISRFTDDYPPLKDIRTQRELAEKMLIDLPKTASLANEAPSLKSQEETGADHLQTKASPALLQVSAPVSDQQGNLNSELQTLNDQELELAQLEREVKLLEGKYAMHVEKLEEARVNDALSLDGISNVKVAQPASLVHKPVSPKKTLLLAGALMVAIVGSMGSAFVAERLDQTLRTTEQVERQLGLPVLASLPYRKRSRKKRAMLAATGDATSAKAAPSCDSAGRHPKYHGLASALRSIGGNGGGPAKTLGIVGCDTSNERSRVAGNFALAASACGTEPVLLIDADARHRRVSKRFHLDGAPGLRDLLSGSAAAKSCVQPSPISNLVVMGPGGKNGGTTAHASTNTVAQLHGIRSDYGLVIVDLPPADELGGIPAASEWIDCAVLVIEAEKTRIQAGQRAKDMLDRAGVQVIGVVLANRRDYIPRWLYQRL